MDTHVIAGNASLGLKHDLAAASAQFLRTKKEGEDESQVGLPMLKTTHSLLNVISEEFASAW